MDWIRNHTWVRLITTVFVVLVGYFFAPIGVSDSALALDLVITALAIAAIIWIVRIQINKHLADEGAFGSLGVLLLLVVAVFALGYHTLAIEDPDQFVGLMTRMDSLYFSMTTMTTTGFGDIYAQGQLARALVTGQMFFDLVFLAALGAAVSARLTRRDAEKALDQD